MIIGVTGYRGRLGTALTEIGCKPISANIISRDELNRAIATIEPDVIINCAGRTDVDACEDDIVETYQTNTFGLQNIASVFSGKIVHISTDYIFDGLKGKYTETDRPSPINTYGFSKLFAEVFLRKIQSALVIRTTILYGSNANCRRSDFVKTVYNKLSGKQLIKCPELYGNPTNVKHLAIGIIDAIEKNLVGIYNISGKDYVSRYELGQKIAEYFGFDKKMVVKGEPYGSAKRLTYGGFDLTKSFSANIPLFSLEDGLKEFQKTL